MARRDLPLGHDPLRAVDPQLATVHPVTAPFEGIIFQIPHVAHNQGLRQPQHCPLCYSRSAPRSAARSERRSAVGHSEFSTKKCGNCARTANGRIARSPAARRAFQASHPCPATGRTSGACPGFVVDRMEPLKRGGADAPGNMQWQTKAAAKAKDKIE
jgi:hypothetical protein